MSLPNFLIAVTPAVTRIVATMLDERARQNERERRQAEQAQARMLAEITQHLEANEMARAERRAEEAEREAEFADKMSELKIAHAAELVAEANKRADVERQAKETTRRLAAEAAAKREMEKVAERARRERETAEEARRAAEDRWRKGIPPEIAPTLAEVDEMRELRGYVRGLCHIAVVGCAGVGKSSLINAFCGVPNAAGGAARAGATETTKRVTRYPDPNNPHIAWYDVPGAGTLHVPSWQYFNDQGLYIFDAIIVAFSDRLSSTDIGVLRTCRKCEIPTLLIRTKSDQSIRNIRRDNGYLTDVDDDSYRRSHSFIHAERDAREQYIHETRETVQDNLERAMLLDQRVYIVSSSALMKLVKGTAPSSRMIDEESLRHDVLTIQPKVQA